MTSTGQGDGELAESEVSLEDPAALVPEYAVATDETGGMSASAV